MLLDSGASAMFRQGWRKLIAKIGGFGQSTHSVLRSGIFCSGHKSGAQPQARFGKPLNRGNAGLVSSPFRRFAVSPFRPRLSVASPQHWKAIGKPSPDLGLNFICITCAVDQNNSFWLVHRECAISFANALIKFGWLLFHPISFAWLMLHSRQGSSSIDIEHESEVRDAIANGERIQALDHLAIQFACRALIHNRGIREAICNHTHAAFQRWLDYLAHELAATSLKQKQLGLGRHVRVVWSKLQKVADTFADRRAPGFPREDIRDAATLKARRQSFGLCGLSATF